MSCTPLPHAFHLSQGSDFLLVPQDAVGEPLYMLFRGIKHQVDKGPVDSVTGKAKYTLNDNRLLREDVEYRPLVREGACVCAHVSVSVRARAVSVCDCVVGVCVWGQSQPGLGLAVGERPLRLA